MTRDSFLKLFPRASEATIRANVDEFPERPAVSTHAPQDRPANAAQSPAAVPSRAPSRKPTPPKQPIETSDAFYARHAHAHAQTSNPILERDSRDGALVTRETERGHPVRFHVVVTSFRRRLLDEDNLCEKYVVDCCRYSGLVSFDSPETTRITVSQQKVTREEDERTEVTITDNGLGQSEIKLTGGNNE